MLNSYHVYSIKLNNWSIISSFEQLDKNIIFSRLIQWPIWEAKGYLGGEAVVLFLSCHLQKHKRMKLHVHSQFKVKHCAFNSVPFVHLTRYNSLYNLPCKCCTHHTPYFIYTLIKLHIASYHSFLVLNKIKYSIASGELHPLIPYFRDSYNTRVSPSLQWILNSPCWCPVVVVFNCSYLICKWSIEVTIGVTNHYMHLTRLQQKSRHGSPTNPGSARPMVNRDSKFKICDRIWENVHISHIRFCTFKGS